MGDELNTKDEQLPRSRDGLSSGGNEDDSVQLLAAFSCNETSNKTDIIALTNE